MVRRKRSTYFYRIVWDVCDGIRYFEERARKRVKSTKGEKKAREKKQLSFPFGWLFQRNSISNLNITSYYCHCSHRNTIFSIKAFIGAEDNFDSNSFECVLVRHFAHFICNTHDYLHVLHRAKEQ